MKISEFENNSIGDEMKLDEYYLMAEKEESAVVEEPKDGEQPPEEVDSESSAETSPAEEAGDSSQEAGTEDNSEASETAEIKTEEAVSTEEAGDSSQETETQGTTEEPETAEIKTEEAIPTEEAGDSSQEAETQGTTEEPETAEGKAEEAGPTLSPEEAAVLGQQTDIVQATYTDMRKDLPEFQSGDTVAVGYRVVEAGKSRIQLFEGVVIKISAGHGLDKTFTVRKISSGVGVERIFPFHSPNIDSVKVLKRGKVRRAKLYYLRDRVGKATRIKERTNL